MNRKVRSNTYADLYSYNNPYKITSVYYPENKKKFNYDSQYTSPYVLSGGQYSSSVWTNPKVYNVAEEDPGISWVL